MDDRIFMNGFKPGEKVKGLLAYLYFNERGQDGFSIFPRGLKRVTIVGVSENMRIFEPAEDAPAVVLVERIFGSKKYLHFLPVFYDAETQKVNILQCWLMFGGGYVFCSDSRFNNHVCEYPVPLHDRSERCPMIHRYKNQAAFAALINGDNNGEIRL